MLKKITEISIAAALLASVTLPALAQATSGAAGAAPTNTVAPATNPKVDAACMQSAIEKRDTALISAVDAYATGVKSALQARKDALKAAWSVTDPKTRRSQIRTVWKAYQTTLASARRALAAGRKGIWNQFYADRKSCGTGAAADDTGTAGMDATL